MFGKILGAIVSAPVKVAAVAVGVIERTVDPYADGPNPALADIAEQIEDGTRYVCGDKD